MTKIRVVVVGAKGRMGRTIVDLADGEHVDIVAQCDLGDAVAEAMKDSDVVIDFSQPDAIDAICRGALAAGKALVIGTTGHSTEQRQLVEKTARSVPIVFASNFSVGVNALFALSGKAGEIVRDFEVSIVESHHKTKKDAPSGTAKTLAEILQAASGSGTPVRIESIREGDIVGDHSVIFSGPGERLELTHRAASREIFARGALRAARWVIGKPAGLYSMQNVLGL